MKNILLTFDIEKLGLSSYGLKLEEKKRNEISIFGLKRILSLLEKYNIKATFFIVSEFALKNKILIKKISRKYEIASHGLEHKDNYLKIPKNESLERIKKSKQIIEKIIGKKIKGFRAPRFQFKDLDILKEAKFEYDSSSHPSLIYGKISNIFKKRRAYKKEILEIPLSVTPFFRFPLFWVAFRNFPFIYSKICSKLVLLDADFINIVFHPWEFYPLNTFKLPHYIKKNTGKKLEKRLEAYIKWCLKQKYKFSTISEYLRL